MTQNTANILVVDDMPANLHLLARMLSERGYQVRPVASGARALEAVQARLPDLILLDISMPEMDGYTVCERLKADERTRDIPILFLSALSETGDKVKAFAVGGEDYITKPFQVEEVLARVQTHLAMRNLRENLKQQVAELDAFAHTVAHDLKNPIGIIIGFAQVLIDEHETMSPQDLADALRHIFQAGKKLDRIVEELMLLTGVRKQQIIPQPLDMGSIVRESIERLQMLIQDQQAQIALPDKAVWPVALGYAPWIEEVWANYISNAIKYGGCPPRIELGADPPLLSFPPQAGGKEGGMARFWARDNGPGLSAEAMADLFTPFTRLEQVRVKGHGLGLSIARRIVEKLGGQVGVESEPGQGSTFFFTLPLRIGN